VSARDDGGRIEQHEHRHAGYEAHDGKGEVIGEVDDLFVDRVDRQEYIELNMGFLGLRSTLVPMELCEVDAEARVVRISRSKTMLRCAPRKKLASLAEDETAAITPEYEDRIREYYGLENVHPPASERPVRVFSSARRTGEVRPVSHRVLERRPADEDDSGDAGARKKEEPAARSGQEVSRSPVVAESVREPALVAGKSATQDTRDAGAREEAADEPAAEPVEEVGPAAGRAPETSVGGEPSGSEVEIMAQYGNESEVEAAVRQMSDAARRATRTLDYRASAFGESGTRLAEESLRSLAERAGEGARGNMRAAQDLQAQGLRQQQAYGAVLGGTASAYASFLSSAAILYQQGLLTATQVALGNLQAANRAWRAGGAARAPEGSAAGGSPDVAEPVVDAVPGNLGRAAHAAPAAPKSSGGIATDGPQESGQGVSGGGA